MSNRGWMLIRVNVAGVEPEFIEQIYNLVPTAERGTPPPAGASGTVQFRMKGDKGEELEVVKDHTDGKPRVWRVPSTGQLLTEIR